MKRKLLATLLALCLIVGMIPVAASAEDGDVAQVGNNTYATLGEAVSNASSGETIKMIADTDISDTGLIVPEEKSLILDINGKKIEASNVPSKNIVVYGDLTIRDSAENSTGKIFTESTYASGGTTALVSAIGENASIILESGFIDAASFTDPANEGQYGLGVMNGGDITITGGKVEAGWYAISGNGNNKTQNSIIVIQGGELISTADYAVYLPHSGETTITGGTIYGAAGGISIQRGTLDISGDALITSKGTGDTGDWGDGTGGQGCAALNIAGEYGDCAVQISGGTLTAEQDALIVRGNNENNKVLEITGGSFSSDVSEYVADGYTMVESDDEYVVEPLGPGNSVAQVGENYFDSLEEAISAAENNSTVILLKNYDSVATGTITVPEGKSIVLDLNGYTVKFSQDFSPILVNGQITIQDTITGGTICSNKAIEVDKGTLTLKSGTIEVSDDYGIYVSNDGHAAVNGGAISSLYAPFTGNNLTGDMNFTVTDGTLTAKYGPAIYMPGQGKLDISGGTLNGGISLRMGQVNISGGTINATTGSIDSPTEYYHYSGNAWLPDALYVFNGTYTSESELYGNSLKLNITGGTFNCANDQGSAVAIYDLGKVEQSSTVTISGDARFSTNATDRSAYQVLSLEDIGVDSPESGYGTEGLVGNVSTSITSGYFTSDPSEYVAKGKVAVESDEPGYNYMVTDANTEAPAEVVTAEPDANVSDSITGEEDKKAAEAIQNALDANVVSGDGLTAAANTVANDNEVTVEQGEAALKEANISVSGKKVSIAIQPYMDISIDAVDMTAKTVTLDITPMYRTVATTANLSEGSDGEIILSGEEDVVNAVQIGTAQPLTVNNTVTVTIPLPKNFAQGGDELFVRHVKSDNRVYFYTGSVGSDVLTFTNPNGFSEMTISKTNDAVAEIDGVGYATLTQALNEAQDGDTVTILENGLTATMSGSERSITLKNGTNDGDSNSISLIINGQKIEIKDGETETFTYTPPTGGGTPSEPEEPTWPFTDVTEGDDWFYDAVAYVYENGIMAGTNDTTFEPYMELDRAMAAQLFYNLEGKPTVTGDSAFTDVTSGHWAVDAITWAAQNDIVAGIGGGLYDPDSNVTREQFAVMLYKYARFKGYDLTAAGDLTQFPDAGSISSWAETALSWANGKGLINGHENGTIDPKGSTIRAQAASIMANFDQNVAK